ncbi:MAG: transcription-repair coupling factor [Nevskiales bacterium]
MRHADTRAVDIFRLALPDTPDSELCWTGLHGSAKALALVNAAAQRTGPVLVVAADEQQAWHLEAALRFYAPPGLDVLHFPDWEVLPYDLFSPHADLISARLAVLYRLPQLARGVVLVAADTLQQRLPPVEYVTGSSFLLKRGERLDLPELRRRLTLAGYQALSEVRAHGEFAVRGALLDLLPMGGSEAYRIELLDDTVESLRVFDPDTQRSTEPIEQIRVLPAREFPLDKTGVEGFRARYRARFSGDLTRARIYQDISQGLVPTGIESYLPLFFERTGSLADYLPANALVASVGELAAALQASQAHIEQRFISRSGDLERPLLRPEEAFILPGKLLTQLRTFPRLQVLETAAVAVQFYTQPPPHFAAKDTDTSDRALADFLQNFKSTASGRALLVAESAGRREVWLERLRKLRLTPEIFPGWSDFVAGSAPLGLTLGELEQGLQLAEPSLAVICESQFSSSRIPAQRLRRRAARDPETILRDLTDLAPGAPVVHLDHGVGRYLGLQTLSAGGATQEFLTLEYAEGAKLYVPVASLHLIHRYTGSEPDQAPLHRLGSEQWSKARERAARKARDTAAELLDIHARRAASPGTALQITHNEYARFAASFPFVETPDQQRAIDQVLADLAVAQPMDRVVCGDVGFGKTEVALRAAFVAVNSQKQVCILVPTTLLAQQHYRNFADRFADWPVKVGVLSRLGSSREQQQVLAQLADGSLDIVIGTHRLLQADVRFKRLGLVIVDEEHRFGVRHKEHIKQLRASVDLLTLTATPIPRTLNMSLAGLRDLSIVATPPVERLAVKTFVAEWTGGLVQEAIQRELRRGGQVYFLHNEVDSIERIAREVQAAVPEARVAIAHGQMRERELESVMLDFYHHRINVLVCTTIIESGIDVPTANTMLINRADKLGLAQLHQLRGRVGRSHHQAYAYLLVPDRRALTGDAQKRLDAIEAMGELGAGFMLATHDLEIRGAGELLGEDQSGQMEEVGFTLYNELLARATRSLKRDASSSGAADPSPFEANTEVDLGVTALLPADFVPDVHARLVLYKRISAAPDQDALRELQVELIDRFGLLPEPAAWLFKLTTLKLQADRLGIRKLEAGAQGGRLRFRAQPSINPAVLIELLQSDPATYRLQGQTQLNFKAQLEQAQMRFNFVYELLELLGQRQVTAAISSP